MTHDVPPGIAIVAGAAGDIGQRVLAGFARRGLTAVAWDRRPVADAGHTRQVDLLDDAATRAAACAVDALPGELRHVAVVAGGGDFDDLRAPGIEHEEPATFRRVVDANLFTAYSVIHSTTAALKRSTGNRSITLLSSINALGGYGAPGYSAAKAALAGLTRALAPQLGPYGIRINVLLLGTVRTANFIRLAHEQGQVPDFAGLAEQIPLRRVLEPDDVAVAMTTVALDMTALTGAELVVDNGQVLHRSFLRPADPD
ncbi:MAG: SDR family oxidoreductase [Chloroflexi bacterium]|nr:SDR family oxidoreductase [Chloroflexota bacterium]